MNKHIVVINGSAGVGKDTFVDQVRYQFISYPSYPAVRNYSSVDWIKKIAKSMGWLGGKSEKERKFLSDLKDLSTWFNDMPFRCMAREVEKFKEDKYLKILFLHIREPKEIKRVVEEFKAKTLLIRNNRVEQIVSNQADAGVYEYEYDYTADNDGTIDELRELAEEFVKQLELSEKVEEVTE